MKKWNIEKDWLITKYVDESMSTRDIAQLLGCSSKTIHRKLHEYSIPTRNREESLKRFRNGAEVLCSNGCGKPIYRKRCIINKYDLFFCSRKCAGEYQSKHNRISSFKVGWRRCKEYRLWRNSVINRDVCCKMCKSTNKLVAHHIYEAKDYPDLVFNINNGVTLCQSCHINVHKLDSTKFIKSLQEAILVE
jgi:5-methylcytosine-specific restriction endonuclease McrA